MMRARRLPHYLQAALAARTAALARGRHLRQADARRYIIARISTTASAARGRNAMHRHILERGPSYQALRKSLR